MMTRLGKAALAAAVAGSTISIADAVYTGATGHTAPWDDPAAPGWATAAVNTLIVVIFVLLAAVLVRAAGRIDGNSRVVPWVRRLLAADLAVLAGVLAVGVVLDGFPGPLEILAGVGFLLMFLLGVTLGICLLRDPGLRGPAVLLTSPLLLLPLAMLASVLAPGWDHPGYAETALYLGLALLGTTTGDQHDRTTPSKKAPTGRPSLIKE